MFHLVKRKIRLINPGGSRGLCSPALSHVDADGKICQVDVSDKGVTHRRAVASCEVLLPEETFRLVKENKLKKGDIMSTVKLAGIQGTKMTSQLIPLCHQLNLDHTEIQIIPNESKNSMEIRAIASCTGKTGVEMEALTGCSIAALCLYDMCKALSQDIVINQVKLLEKSGGKTSFKRE